MNVRNPWTVTLGDVAAALSAMPEVTPALRERIMEAIYQQIRETTEVEVEADGRSEDEECGATRNHDKESG